MNRIFTLFCAAIMGSAAASAAVTVTFNGSEVKDGDIINFTASDIEEIIPDFLYVLELKGVVNVTDGPVQCSVSTNYSSCQFCTTSCFSWKSQLDGSYATVCEMEDGSTDFSFHFNYNEKPAGTQYVKMTVDPDISPLTFTVNVDCSAGINDVAADSNGVYDVYSILGARVLTTTDASAVNSLSPGIYIVNGKKVVVR